MNKSRNKENQTTEFQSKKYILRAVNSFAYSTIISLITLLLIETISTALGNRVASMTPEFVSYFPSETIAFAIDLLLYGLFGATFSVMTFIYDIDSLGFVVQNIIYCVATAAIWIPIINFIWQLWKYPQALICTIAGFLVTYIIMTVIAYNKARKDIADVNRLLESTPAQAK